MKVWIVKGPFPSVLPVSFYYLELGRAEEIAKSMGEGYRAVECRLEEVGDERPDQENDGGGTGEGNGGCGEGPGQGGGG